MINFSQAKLQTHYMIRNIRQDRTELVFLGHPYRLSKLIIRISYIMINQLYYIVLITDNRPKLLSYHLEPWYLLGSLDYHIISKVIFRFSKLFISNQNLNLNFQNYYIILKMIYKFSKLLFHITMDHGYDPSGLSENSEIVSLFSINPDGS